MADIFDEINEEMRRDRTSALWTKYGKYVIGLAVAVIVVVAGRQAYVGYERSQAEAAANAFYSALQTDDSAAALAELDLPAGYTMLVDFRQAAALADEGDAAAASDAFLALSERTDIDVIYRDIARLISVQVAPATADVATLEARIADMAALAGPLQALALETNAGLALRRGDIEAARNALQQITTLSDVSGTMRQRAQQMLIVIGGEVSE